MWKLIGLKFWTLGRPVSTPVCLMPISLHVSVYFWSAADRVNINKLMWGKLGRDVFLLKISLFHFFKCWKQQWKLYELSGYLHSNILGTILGIRRFRDFGRGIEVYVSLCWFLGRLMREWFVKLRFSGLIPSPLNVSTIYVCMLGPFGTDHASYLSQARNHRFFRLESGIPEFWAHSRMTVWLIHQL